MWPPTEAAVLAPLTDTELASALRDANQAGLSVMPRGGGTKAGWGNPPARCDRILSTARLCRVTEHAWADLTVCVEAGCTIQSLQDTLARHGQRVAMDPLWPERATVGGVLSTNDTGALRLRYGGLRDLIIGITVALADGTLARGGGKVVKNVAGYDLPKLVTGALGTLGIITAATFRVHPRPVLSRTLTFGGAPHRFMAAVCDSILVPSAVQTRTGTNRAPQTDVLFEGTGAGVDAQVRRARELAGSPGSEHGDGIWRAREALWSSDDESHVIKLSVLPADIGVALSTVETAAAAHGLAWNAVYYATGIGWIGLQGNPQATLPAIAQIRKAIESKQGSAVYISPRVSPMLDAWGEVGDALPIMRAIKDRFDPKMTLNPGRFVGGI